MQRYGPSMDLLRLDLEYIYIKRNGEIVDSLDVYEFYLNLVSFKDIYLQDGDYIISII